MRRAWIQQVTANNIRRGFAFYLIKDTVAAYEEDDEVDTSKHANIADAAVSLNADVHYSVPIFAG